MYSLTLAGPLVSGLHQGEQVGVMGQVLPDESGVHLVVLRVRAGVRPALDVAAPQPTIFGAGARWFHSGGIFAALSPTTSDLIVEGMKAAQASGAVTSFDLNYRAKLWATIGGPAKG